jgi:protease-4
MIRTLLKLGAIAATVCLGIGIGWFVFVVAPAELDVSVATVLAVVTVAGVVLNVAIDGINERFATYNTAEVHVDGLIGRGSGKTTPVVGSDRVSADDLAEQIERADADGKVRALLVTLNTPGGSPVPSEDVRLAIREFDGPALAYVTDVCASGGYWIASECDQIVARPQSMIGSIGVRASMNNYARLADELGIEHERFVAGRFKDAGYPLREMDDEERSYIQRRVETHYEKFVERVSEGRGLDPDAVRETEARVFLGERARERDLVDAVGTRSDVEDAVAERIGADEPVVREFSPSNGFRERLVSSTGRVAYAFGAGVASVFSPAEDSTLEHRL